MQRKIFAACIMFLCAGGVMLGVFLRHSARDHVWRWLAAANVTARDMFGASSVSKEGEERIYVDVRETFSMKDRGAMGAAPGSEGGPAADAKEKDILIEQELSWCDFGRGGEPSRRDVIINEIAWMGDERSSGNEWIELKNLSSFPVNISGWQLIDMGGQIRIAFDKDAEISGGGFFLLERTNDDSARGVAADTIYHGSLSDTEESVRLFDKNCELVDDAAANPNWAAGDKQSKKTMERNRVDVGWHTSENSGGTPRAENSQRGEVAVAEQNKEQVQVVQEAEHNNDPQEEAPADIRVVINEIQIAGESAADEFVELYNPTANPITLTGWSLKRKSSSGTEYSLVVAGRLEGKIIPAHGYLLLANEGGYKGSVAADAAWPKSNSIAANNTILLYAPDGRVADKVGFGGATDYEGNPVTQNPGARESAARSSGIDTNNNAMDFAVVPASPQNSSSQ